MRKLAAMLIAAVAALSLSLSAMAATDTSDWVSDEVAGAITFYKNYTVTGGTTGTYPAETVSFVSTPASDNPDTTKNLTVAATIITQAARNEIKVSLPSYSEVGEYKYTITETAGDTQGVTYDTTTSINISVLVTYDYTDSKLAVQYGIDNAGTEEDPVKNDTITNTYGAGSLAVSKTVTGNLGDKNEDFTITVTFKKDGTKTVNGTIRYTDDGIEYSVIPQMWQGDYAIITFSIKDGETVTFSNIPAGVTYEVTELEQNQNGYSTTYAFSDSTKVITAEDTDTAVITNEKSTNIDTGLDLGRSLPYILAALAAGALIVVVAVRRRSYR